MNQGLTLIGTMVAVALSGIVAVIASELATNQLSLVKVEELHDRRQAILKFYTDMLKNEAIIQCTIEGNTGIKAYIKKYQTSSAVTAAKLVPPSCIGSLIPATGMYLGESISIARTDGWWQLNFSWEGKGKGTIDFIVELCFDRNKYNAVYPTATIQALQWECPNKKTVRVRYSENSISAGEKDCGTKPVVNIALHTASRSVTCAAHPLVNISTCPYSIHKIDANGNIVCSNRCEFLPGGAYASSNKGILGFNCPGVVETGGYFLKQNQFCTGSVVRGINSAAGLNCVTHRGYQGLRGPDQSCPSGEDCHCPTGGAYDCRCKRDPTTEICNVTGSDTCARGSTC